VPQQPVESPDPGPGPEVADLAGRLFDMARNGDAENLAAYLDAGVPSI
jgi:hypothetical protein